MPTIHYQKIKEQIEKTASYQTKLIEALKVDVLALVTQMEKLQVTDETECLKLAKEADKKLASMGRYNLSAYTISGNDKNPSYPDIEAGYEATLKKYLRKVSGVK